MRGRSTADEMKGVIYRKRNALPHGPRRLEKAGSSQT